MALVEDLDEIVSWMRERGVLRMQRGDTLIELGPMPMPKLIEAAVTDEEAAREGEKLLAKEQIDSEVFDFMASEGVPLGWSPSGGT